LPSFIGYVPTQPEFIRGFFDLAPVTSSDVVYDLGSGDGRVLFHALEKGAGRVVGVELNPELVREAHQAAKAKGLDNRASFLQADLMDVNLAEATLVFCFLFPTASTALKAKLTAELRPGARVVMESFRVPDWIPTRTVDISSRWFYLYNMPAICTENASAFLTNGHRNQ
jgi:SAM-dependent methyltransferase